jgi:hypothetical protein
MARGETRYSRDLLGVLQRWEFPGCTDVSLTPDESRILNGEEVEIHTQIPTMRQIIDEILPMARDKVERYRDPGGNVPEGWHK